MGEDSSLLGDREQEKIDYVRRQFDGIRFLWKIPKTRFFLKFLIVLFVSMGVTILVLSALISLGINILNYLILHFIDEIFLKK